MRGGATRLDAPPGRRCRLRVPLPALHGPVSSSPDPPFGRKVRVRVETPKGAFVKRGFRDGRLRVVFVAPFRCPFDYGHVPDLQADDGMERDAVWLGARARPLDIVEGEVVAVVRFTDHGAEDDKWVVRPSGPVDPAEVARLASFFTFYARVKRLFGRRTTFDGVRLPPERA